MSSWAHNVYNELSDVLVPLTGELAREAVLYNEHRVMLRAHMVNDNDLSVAHRELIGYFVAMRGGGNLVDLDGMRVVANRLMDQVFELNVGYLCAARCLSHILEIRMPSLVLFNRIVFSSLVQQHLEPHRRQRVDLQRDRWFFLFLNLQSEYHDGPIGEVVFWRWMNRAVRTLNYMSPQKAVRVLMESSSSIRGVVRFYMGHLRLLKWRQRRKSRKRRRDDSESVLGDCCVCLEHKVVLRTVCDHLICRGCVDAWSKSTCPVCRRVSYV